MRNIITYLKDKGKLSFEEYPFNDIDGLLLSQLAYIEFEHYVPSIDDNLPAFLASSIKDKEIIKKICAPTLNPRCNRIMLSILLTSRRFKDMYINWAKIIIDTKKIEQFGAMTFIFPKFIYVGIRGTDLSLLGWKEDFYLALEEQIPAQKDSLNYLIEVSKKTNLPIYVGGHSKGANLALYAAYKAPDEIKNRIIKIYNNDGPGFKNNIFEEEEYQKIKSKVFKVVPRDTRIGILLNHLSSDVIVKSKKLGILQHDPYNWILDKDYKYKSSEKETISASILDKTIMDFVNSYNEDEAKELTNLLFNAVSYGDIRSVGQMLAHPIGYLFGFGKNYFKMNKADKTKIKAATKNFLKLWRRNLKNSILINKNGTKEIKKSSNLWWFF